MSERITVHRDLKPVYDIVLESSFDCLPAELQFLSIQHKKICIVTDHNVAPLYLEEVRSILDPFCYMITSFVILAGEVNKNLNTVKSLYEFLITNQFDRNDLLIALGGGVVGDLCGFTAATYLRGVDFVQIPTTLLSQVDSSIGGKTGVDFDSYKNMVGAFHMPQLVYTNLQTLHTLPEEQFASGMGEIIKHGLIQNREYYRWLGEHKDEIRERNLSICKAMIIESNQIKRRIVEADPTEQGDRALLNFGHTLGHAIEKLMDFQLLHGHCVGLGCLSAAYICAGRGMLSIRDVEELKILLNYFQLPISVRNIQISQVIAATKKDKKMEAGIIKFILLREIGNAYVDRTVSDQEMETGLAYIFQ